MINYKAAQKADLDTRVRIQVVLLTTVMLGQGIAFDQQGSELLRSKSFTRDSYDPGDWFNRIDYSLQDNNCNVGVSRSNDDGNDYDIIARVKDAVAILGEMELKQMTAFYQELAALCKSSPLFTLGDGATMMKRADFRNTDVDQQISLLVVAIDDGMQAGVSLDSRVGGIVVVINAAPKSRTPQDFTGASLQLSAIQRTAGGRSLTNSVQVAADSSVMLPTWSVTVLKLPQGKSQGAGLPVSSK